MRGDVNCLQKERSEQSHNAISGQDKLKQMQKSLSNSENERRILCERLDASQNTINDLRRSQQSQHDVVQRLQEQTAELEVQKSALDSQLRITKWNQEASEQLGTVGGSHDDDISRQLLTVQREKAELRGKVDALTDKLRHLENEKRSKFSGHVQFDRSEKSLYGDRDGELDSNRIETDSCLSRAGGGGGGVGIGTTGHMSLMTSYNCGFDHSLMDQENRDLRLKVRRLETLLAEKESELARAKTKLHDSSKCLPGDSERYRTAQIQAERLLDAREQSHRQQVLRLENQVINTYFKNLLYAHIILLL